MRPRTKKDCAYQYMCPLVNSPCIKLCADHKRLNCPKLVELDLEFCLLELRTEARLFASTKYRGLGCLYFSDMLHSVRTERVAKSNYNSIRTRLFVDNCTAISPRNFPIDTKQQLLFRDETLDEGNVRTIKLDFTCHVFIALS
jgi:hypothetical protein